MATPKEQHDARSRTPDGGMTPAERADASRELSRSSAAPDGAEEQADGQPENELELHDHSGGGSGGSSRNERVEEGPGERR